MKKQLYEINKDVVKRVGADFDRELKDIEKGRKKMKTGRMSRGKLTNKLVKHNSWSLIKEDLINYEK